MPFPIDRSRFLFLTASIAAAACGKSVGTGPSGVEKVEVPQAREELPQPASPVSTEPAEPLRHACDFALPPGVQMNPTCEGANWSRTVCEQSQGERRLPAEARVELHQCLEKNGGTKKICSVEETYACSAKALGHVTPEPYTDEPCRRVMDVCGNKTTMAQCQGVLSIRKPEFRKRAEFCLIGPGKRCNPPGWCAFGDPDTTFIPSF